LQEEVLFRGYLLPKQEAAIGKHAWVLNGFAFNFAHLLVYDFASLLLISPFCFLLAYKVQKHKNTSIGLLAHLLLNLGFIVRLLMV
jgi:membrane protease YdiL (CAAX protease family)